MSHEEWTDANGTPNPGSDAAVEPADANTMEIARSRPVTVGDPYAIGPGTIRRHTACRVRPVATWFDAEGVPVWSEIWPWVDVPADRWVSLGETRHLTARGVEMRLTLDGVEPMSHEVHHVDGAELLARDGL